MIARAFDKGFDAAVILTKGTKSLAAQTISRVKQDFGDFILADQVEVFDIMTLPDQLTKYELNRKLVFVVKKEDDNMRRLLEAFMVKYPELRKRRYLSSMMKLILPPLAGEK